MVFILDEGSVFDAPLNRIWEYLISPEEHKHTAIKLISREMVSDNSVIITNEVSLGSGAALRNKVKMTRFSPLGTAQEFLEGPLAGSKAFLHYIPKGNKTGVTVVGEYVGKGMDDKTLKKTVMDYLTVAFEEDNANLRKK